MSTWTGATPAMSATKEVRRPQAERTDPSCAVVPLVVEAFAAATQTENTRVYCVLSMYNSSTKGCQWAESSGVIAVFS